MIFDLLVFGAGTCAFFLFCGAVERALTHFESTKED